MNRGFSASCGSASGAVRVSASGVVGGICSKNVFNPRAAGTSSKQGSKTIGQYAHHDGSLGMRCASNQDKDFQTVMASRFARARLKGSVARALFIGDHLQMANCQSGRAFTPPIYCFSICSTSAKKSLNAAIPPVRRPAETIFDLIISSSNFWVWWNLGVRLLNRFV